MVNDINRTLVKSTEMVINGATLIRLYWYDHSTGITMVIDSPIQIGYGIPEEDLIEDIPVEEPEVVQTIDVRGNAD